MSRVKNDTDLLLRVRQNKKGNVRNDTDLLLRVRQDKNSRVKNDADLLLRVRRDRERARVKSARPVTKSKTRRVEEIMTQTCW